MILLSSLILLVAGITVVAFATAVACIQSGRHSCCSWRPLSSWWFPVAGLSAIANIPGVTNGVVGVSAVPFEHAVAGGPAVTGFPAVKGILAVDSVPSDPGVHILAGGFTYWIVDELHYRTIGLWLSGCIFFFAIKLSKYRISYWRIQETIGLSDNGLRPQSIRLSEIGLRKNFWLPTSANS